MQTITKIPASVRKPKNRTTQQALSLTPVRQWVLLQTACSYTEMCEDAFRKFAIENKLRFSEGKRNTRYLISEIDSVFFNLSKKPA